MKEQFILKNRFVFPALLIAFIGGHWYFHFKKNLVFRQNPLLTSGNNLLVLLVALVSIMFFISLGIKLAKYNLQGLIFIGESSMAVYVMHILIASGTRIIFQQFLNITEPSIHLFLGVTMGVIIPTLLMYFFSQKIQVLFLPPKKLLKYLI